MQHSPLDNKLVLLILLSFTIFGNIEHFQTHHSFNITNLIWLILFSTLFFLKIKKDWFPNSENNIESAKELINYENKLDNSATHKIQINNELLFILIKNLNQHKLSKKQQYNNKGYER